MHIAYLSAGSNLGDRRHNLKSALKRMDGAGTVRATSSLFETEPVGLRDQPWFLNLAFELATGLPAEGLLRFCQTTEVRLGRIRTFRNAPRTVDLDLLFFDDDVINEPDLTVPHPRMGQRRFVLVPLAEIAPGLRHPVSKLTIREMLQRCEDPSEVRPYDWADG
jgi:2-amino-4-hydroxy-6-hydroxymethyldihydropteridine diphosphokinase